MHNGEWVLFFWVLANQAGVPIPAAPWLLAAGALASGNGPSFGLVLAIAVGAALCADLVWYGLGRWRGARAVSALFRLLRRPPASVDRVERVFFTHQRRFMWSARFLPELNPVAAGLAGATRVRPTRFLRHAAGSALGWTVAWAGAGYLLGGAMAATPERFGILPTVLIALVLAGVAVSALIVVARHRRGCLPEKATAA
jgi:membrane protein DedA with SNARE-associated domain